MLRLSGTWGLLLSALWRTVEFALDDRELDGDPGLQV